MKALIIENSEPMAGMICGILEEAGMKTHVVGDVDSGLEEYADPGYGVVILDTGVDASKGMRFVTDITPDCTEGPGRRERTENSKRGAGVIVIRTVSERVPSDCPRVKAELVKPFTVQELKDAVAAALPKDSEPVFPDGREEPAADPDVELGRLGITYGESYVFFTRKSDTVMDITGTFAKAGYDMFLITSSRAKAAMDRYGLDKGAEVFTLRGHYYRLGTMVESAVSFIEGHGRPVVAIDDLDGLIEHSTVDRTVAALREILSVRKRPGYTVLVSADGELLTKNVRDILTEIMVEYKKE